MSNNQEDDGLLLHTMQTQFYELRYSVAQSTFKEIRDKLDHVIHGPTMAVTEILVQYSREDQLLFLIEQMRQAARDILEMLPDQDHAS